MSPSMMTSWWKDNPPQHLPGLLHGTAAEFPDRVLISRRQGQSWVDLTSQQFLDHVNSVARGLVAAGVEPEDRVVLMAKTRYEWALLDLAILSTGAIVVPVYETSSANQLAWIMENSRVTWALTESDALAATARAAADQAGAQLKGVWAMDAKTTEGIDQLIAGGAEVDQAEIDRRCEGLGRETLATLIYTSGTTGRPKACMLPHRAFIDEVTAAYQGLPELFEDDSSTLLFLPLAHVFGRMVHFAVIGAGARTGHTDIARVAKDLPVFKPTFVLAVPRVFEKIYESAHLKATKGGKEKIFAAATQTAIDYSKALDAGRVPLVLRAKHKLFTKLVYGKVQAAFGGELTWAISGGAALGERLGHYFRGMGVNIMEGWGLTETSAAATVNRPSMQKIGTVGVPLPGFEARLSDEGEIQVRGGHVFAGYENNPEETAKVLAEDGWFSTGDLGEIDDDGFLRIIGRAKDILVTAAGKNVAPGPLEDILRSHRLVSEAMVVGDGRPTVMALITLDEEQLPEWLKHHHREVVPASELTEDEQVRAAIQKVVDKANASVSKAEAIKKFTILSRDFTLEDEEITNSLKVRRHIVTEHFKDEINAMYGTRDSQLRD
ncbi:long-chain fatty acid--CoA ligase [Kytococcus sedentarius]|uniref:AMP-forming long-chain acyl-CoA synthetase n=1 Tax=Kytococcus sedentarius (strain ATCC 14392 / DSM 20547 / JCM 11482 / CCUG 33030 / NBRC 15357 / NCTC 11040 / CCM 314 / 541) TaxID=478801 RepID=C7NIX9_KYTSD|nr:long-chain fatty acid--CoA ligase [Kytococcus sedentarius]ACV05204.1 AMP-forming long-chain acyl-CoA synthetase [Kytococcus sedentarius DSM 20547]QQB63669.1 long-chain fatty acid--CoA ligase [Kytococcus sedentarius]STX13389.1 Long-chain-fatty-acid--CoA ligase FadD15 [Kytococcus sedentarius]